jgi:membrane-associated protease RseP (regulator of RpoE activity)
MTASQWLRALLVVGLIVLLTAKLGVWALVVLAGLLISITLHELGHYLAAKRAGMLVTEFFLGFGPRIWSFRRGETEYGLKLVPAGAYVRIIGMNNLEEVPPEDEARTYRQANFPNRFLTVVAGVTMNALIAVVLIWVLLAVVGLPGGKILTSSPDLPTDIERVFPASPAARAGIRADDRIVRFDGVAVSDFDELRGEVQANMGESVQVVYVRDGQTRTTTLTPGAYRVPQDGSTGCGLGVGAAPPVVDDDERMNPIAAVPRSFVELGRVTGLTIQGLGRLFSPTGLKDYGRQVVDAQDEKSAPSKECVPVAATNPGGGAAGGGSGSGSSAEPEVPNRVLSLVGLFQIGTSGASAELLLVLFAGLNITLAVVNLIPLLPFDGGHIAVAVFERIQERRKRMQGRYFADVAKLLPLTYAVVLILFLLMISSIYLDIASPITE